jgi:predicted DNA-binding antitoxin AbrB/MazE fold protein
MTKILDAVFDGAVFRPDTEVELETGTRVELEVRVKTPAVKRTKSFLDTALSLHLKGPSDFSSRLDDYLYGEKKFDEE